MPSKDAALIDAMLSEFVRSLVGKFPEKIDFILLFGSAARGEFRAGTSDVDLIIQVKEEQDRDAVSAHAEKILWSLDRKHGTRLREVCSTKKGDAFGILEKKASLYRPFAVTGPDDIDWENGKISMKSLGAFAFVAPVSQFAKKVRREGKILHGRDVLKTMKVRESFADNVKSLIVPYALSLFACLIAVPFPDRALRYSVKAVLYGIDNQLALAGGDYARKTHLNLMILRSELGELYSIRLAREALLAKRDFDAVKKDWSYIDKLAFCAQAPAYISYNNLMSLLHHIK
ncbi:MAG: nucleotidyltransferase domain-containing protein [Candidatus Micrarchaeota archaeon]